VGATAEPLAIPHDVELAWLRREHEIEGDSEDDTRLLGQMAGQARDYLDSFYWCQRVKRLYLGLGIGGVVAIFLVEVEHDRPEVSDWLWVVIGDLPPLYMPSEVGRNPVAALDAYIGAMEEWIEAVRAGRSLEHVAPVEVEPSDDNADRLERRLNYLDSEILSRHREALSDT